MVRHDLHKGCFGVLPLHVAAHPYNCISYNGLPVTHNAVQLIGNFTDISALDHPNLCQYLDLVRGKGELVGIVLEYHETTLADKLGETRNRTNPSKFPLPRTQILYDVLQGLRYLHSKGIVNRSLTLQNIVYDKQHRAAKITNYGIFYLTSGGKSVDFFVGERVLTPPEVLLDGPSSTKSDLWTLGMITLCLLKDTHILGKNDRLSSILRAVFRPGTDIRTRCEVLGITVPDEYIEFLERSLTLKPTERASAGELLGLHLFSDHKECLVTQQPLYPFHLTKEAYLKESDEVNEEELEDPLAHVCTLSELYELWKMCGGDALLELVKMDVIRGSLPICDMPLISLPSGQIYQSHRPQTLGEDQQVYRLSPSPILKRLAHVEPEVYYPSIDVENKLNEGMREMSKLPVVIKERNVEYQLHRILLFNHLLYGYPYTRDKIRSEAVADIPPLHRHFTWAALLNVKGDIQTYYNNIDKTQSLGPIDRQIDVDIPRCHQYQPFLSSRNGHEKLRRVLKAWVIDNPNLTYWQGLDSLAAPFLVLYPANEALAYTCLKEFVKKYVNNFFLRDNSTVMTEYLCVFCHLVTFHDPELAIHLENMGFIPELYAIPWFLTMFTHVFPLQKVFYLWDTMLLGNSSFPMFLGAAILIHVRETLLSYEFNECILLFSDMPDVDIDQVIKEAMKMYQVTPMTLTYRKNSYHEHENELSPPQSPSGQSKYTYNFTKSFLTHHLTSFPDVPELKEDVCARILVQDLAALLRNEEKAIKRGAITTSYVNVVDIRSPEVFAVGHIPDSMNIPISQALITRDGHVSNPQVKTLLKYRRKPDALTVIVGPNLATTLKFCKMLINLHFLHVTMVHGGTSALSQAGMLCASANI